MMSELQGKTAIVTGASKGIGAAIAKTLGAAGAAVVVNYASDKAGAERVVAGITGAGGKAIAIHANVAKPADVARLFDEAKSAFGGVDILINNAGVYQFAPAEEFTEELYRRTFDVNVLGPLAAIQQAVKHFPATGGSIVNISSVAGTAAIATTSVYSATKAALDSITRTLGAELGPKNIRVNSLSPGGTETEGVHTAGVIGSDFEARMVADTPLGRLGQPDDIAKVALFLASDASSWVTGAVILTSGGAR
jgi:3-oxoacyl-[acyl-carrier protein] reductase